MENHRRAKRSAAPVFAPVGLDGWTMLLESLNALIAAGDDALLTTCGLPTVQHAISQVQQGSLTFPALGELRIKGGALQTVHLGCDSLLCGQLASLIEPDSSETGIETLTNRFLRQLLSELATRNPRGKVHSLDIGPIDLVSRGLRSFGIRLETGVGQLYILAEVPSRMEMEIAKGSDYLQTMETAYLPRDWGNRQTIDSPRAVENFLVFLRKVEGDVSFEFPGGEDFSCLHGGILLGPGTYDGERGLKFCTDLSAATEAGLSRGDEVRATVGIDDRSLQFVVRFLGEGNHSLTNGAELPCAFFEPPAELTIMQRRLAFRIPVRSDVSVVLRCGEEGNAASPWEGQGQDGAPLYKGALADLSFSGARIVASGVDENEVQVPCLEINRRVVCDIHFPDLAEPLSLLGVVRRSTSRLVDRNERLQEVGLEFLITGDLDRVALEHVRQFVLAEQRARLSQRVHISNPAG